MAKCIDDLFTSGVYSSSTPQTDSFQQNLIRWCDEVRYTPEYDNRVIAVEKMLICRNNHEALLTLSNLGLTELPSFLKYLLPHLKTLDVSTNRLKDLSDLPKKLTTLDASRNDLIDLHDLPENLTSLNASYNHLTDLPDRLPRSLKILDASFNKLTTLSNHLPETITTIRAIHNWLKALPDPLPAALATLNVSDNWLTALPNQLSETIATLVVSGNRLTDLPHHFPEALTTFDASSNRLRTLPLSLTRLPNISVISVRENRFTENAVLEFQEEIRRVKGENGIQFIYSDYNAPNLEGYASLEETMTWWLQQYRDGFLREDDWRHPSIDPEHHFLKFYRELISLGTTDKTDLNEFLQILKTAEDIVTYRDRGYLIYQVDQMLKRGAKAEEYRDAMIGEISKALSTGSYLAKPFFSHLNAIHDKYFRHLKKFPYLDYEF